MAFQLPYLVYGVVVTTRGTAPNSIVRINSDVQTTTNSEGQYVLDIANLNDDYSTGDELTIETWDEHDKEYVSTTTNVIADVGGEEKNLFPVERDEHNNQGRNSETRQVEVRLVGNTPVTTDNPFPVLTEDRNFVQQLSYYSGTTRVEYIGYANPGTPTSEAKWRIKKLFYNSDNATSKIEWCKGNTEFDKKWDDRANYQYA